MALRKSCSNSKALLLVLLLLPIAIGVLWAGSGQAVSARTRTFGADRIVGIESLPEGDVCDMPAEPQSLAAAIVAMESVLPGNSAVCTLPPAASAGMAAAAAQAAAPGVDVAVGPGTVYQSRTRAGNIDRRPLRYIKDPNPAWSAIAVNAENDMVVMTDENLFRIVEYSRRDNTPAAGPITQPKRVIGGDETHSEMMCGAYIDPKTLEVYVTNNDTQDWLPVFSREARGNVKPDRVLATPHRTWGIAADEQRQELYMTIQNPSAIIVYRKQAANAEAPLRLIEGDATELADPHGIALDMTNDLMIVANHGHRRFYGGPAVSTMKGSWEEWIAVPNNLNGLPRRFLPGGAFEMPSINIYARGATGNTAPLRVIKGPRTQLNWPSHVSVHEGRGEIFVANDAGDSVLVFRVTDSGDAAPTRVIKGPRTRIKNPTGVTVDAANNELWVANMGNFTATVFPITASGDVVPIRQIRAGPIDGEALLIGNPGAVGYDSKRQEILVPN